MSLITYPVATMPRVFLPRSFSAGLQTNTRSFASPFGGSEQVADMLNDRWAFALELAARNHDEAASVEAFVNAMRGMSNTTNLHHFGRPTPRGTLAGSPALVAPAAQGAASITVGAVAGQTLRAGDMLGVGGLLVQVAADCVANASGVITVPLVNRLRRAVAGLSRASTATYIDGAGVLQTAGVNVPRFQGGAVLVEGVGTNYILQSQALSSSVWVGGSVSAASENWRAVPFWTVAKATAGLAETRFQILADTVPAGMWVTLTVALLAGSSSQIQLGVFDNTASSWGLNTNAIVQIVEGPGVLSVQVGSSTIVSALSSSVPTLLRISRLFVTAGVPRIIFYMDTGASTTIGASNKLTRVQLEVGATPTSYIPTTTAPATRAADVVTPVVWDRPTGTFRLASQPRVVYLGGYAEAVAMDFVEHIA